MKLFRYTIIVLLAIGFSNAFPTWGIGVSPPRGPGWSPAAASGLYNGWNPYPGGYGYAGGIPSYVGAYSASPSYPGYTPGLYGLNYLNLRG